MRPAAAASVLAVAVVVVPASGGAASVLAVVVAVMVAGAAAVVVGMVSAGGAAGAASAAVALESPDVTDAPPPDDPPPHPPTANASAAAAASPPCNTWRQRPERAHRRPDVDSGRSDSRPKASVGTKPKLEQVGGSGHRPGPAAGRGQPAAATASNETSVKRVTVAGTTPKARVAATVNPRAERSENGTAMRPAAAASSVGRSNHMRAAILP